MACTCFGNLVNGLSTFILVLSLEVQLVETNTSSQITATSTYLDRDSIPALRTTLIRQPSTLRNQCSQSPKNIHLTIWVKRNRFRNSKFGVPISRNLGVSQKLEPPELVRVFLTRYANLTAQSTTIAGAKYHNSFNRKGRTS